MEASTIFYAYFGTETLYENNTTSKTATDYIYAGGMRLGRLSGGVINYYHEDNLGRMQHGRAALDEEGNPFQIHHINGRDIPDPHNPANLEILTQLQHYLRHFLPFLS